MGKKFFFRGQMTLFGCMKEMNAGIDMHTLPDKAKVAVAVAMTNTVLNREEVVGDPNVLKFCGQGGVNRDGVLVRGLAMGSKPVRLAASRT